MLVRNIGQKVFSKASLRNIVAGTMMTVGTMAGHVHGQTPASKVRGLVEGSTFNKARKELYSTVYGGLNNVDAPSTSGSINWYASYLCSVKQGESVVVGGQYGFLPIKSNAMFPSNSFKLTGGVIYDGFKNFFGFAGIKASPRIIKTGRGEQGVYLTAGAKYVKSLETDFAKPIYDGGLKYVIKGGSGQQSNSAYVSFIRNEAAIDKNMIEAGYHQQFHPGFSASRIDLNFFYNRQLGKGPITYNEQASLNGHTFPITANKGFLGVRVTGYLGSSADGGGGFFSRLLGNNNGHRYANNFRR